MDYKEIELWIRNNILKNNFSLSFLPKNGKIFDQKYYENYIDFTGLNNKLNSIGKKLKKTNNNCILWFKVNFIDNAIADLVGMGKISDFDEMNIFSSILILDKPKQNGDSVICLIDDTKEWLIKMDYCRSESRIFITTYGSGEIITLLK